MLIFIIIRIIHSSVNYKLFTYSSLILLLVFIVPEIVVKLKLIISLLNNNILIIDIIYDYTWNLINYREKKWIFIYWYFSNTYNTSNFGKLNNCSGNLPLKGFDFDSTTFVSVLLIISRIKE